MTTQTAPKTEPTELALRDRIHRIFCGDAPPLEPAPVTPTFWVGPAEEQKIADAKDIHERLELTDQLDVPLDENRWLNTPHVDLGGSSPEEMLIGDQQSRERLEVFVTAVETAIRGSFS